MSDIILLNNIFNGRYVENNLGHEWINIFKPDKDDYSYIYINPDGEINDESKRDKLKYIIFITKYNEKSTAKIVSIVDLNGAEYCNENPNMNINPKYNDIYLKNYYNYNDNKNHIYYTYKVKKIYKPKKDIYFKYLENGEKEDNNFVILSRKFLNQSQRTYFDKDKNKFDYDKLINIIEDRSNLEEVESISYELYELKKYDKKEELLKDNFLTIIGKEDDEIIFSNWIYYFFDKRKDILIDFLNTVLLEQKNLITDVEIHKEEQTRDNKGRIDLLIITKKIVFIIENKIKSDLHNDLKCYEDYVEENYKGKDIKSYIFVPNYNSNIIESQRESQKKKLQSEWKIIKYKELYDFFSKFSDDNDFYKKFIPCFKKHTSDTDNTIKNEMIKKLIKKEKEFNNYKKYL